MAIKLFVPYGGYKPGTIVVLPRRETESELIAQGIAQDDSYVNVTTGDFTTNQLSGVCGIAAAQSTVTMTNPNIDACSHVNAYLRGSSADGTAFYVTRVVTTSTNTVIFVLNAACTAKVTVAWAIVNGRYNQS